MTELEEPSGKYQPEEESDMDVSELEVLQCVSTLNSYELGSIRECSTS